MAVEVAGLGVVVSGWLMIFGWVSRRFERQADTFAVRHLSLSYPSAPGAPAVFDPSAIAVYCQTLLRVAAINHTAADRRSWRHGSMRWRCDYLGTLAGRPLVGCAIDRTVGWTCAAGAVVLLGLLLFEGLRSQPGA
jgi:STE24 endopeptidase